MRLLYTKTLQEQLVQNDLPFLRDALSSVSPCTGDDAFSFAICIGGQNYLCLRRFNQVQLEGHRETSEEAQAFEEIIEWERHTKDGVRSGLEFEPSRSTWSKICRESDLCFGKKCEFKEECYFNKARKKEYKAQILVTNHHLFFANLVNDGCVLPKFDAVVFDEAHTLEDVATSYFSIEISSLKVKFLLDSIFNPKTGKGMLSRLLPTREKGIEIEQALIEAKEASDLLFSEAINKFGDERAATRIMKKGALDNTLSRPLSNLSSLLRLLRDQTRTEEGRLEIEAYIRRCDETNQNLSTFIDQGLEEGVFWVEVERRQKTRQTRFPDDRQSVSLFEPLSPGSQRCSLFAAPINIADEFRMRVFNKIRPVVLTSATLSTNGTFHYIRERLGVPVRLGDPEEHFQMTDTGGITLQATREECIEKIIGSPFNFSENALIYLPENIPDPNREPGEFKLKVMEQVKEILITTQGKSFVLFTSFEMLNTVYEGLKTDLSSFALFRQGDKPRYKLVEEFKRNSNSVLFGTITFWQGIDVPGKALECVIITRLPFAVPDDPIIEARMELLKKQQKSPFMHYQIPQAITLLRQGFGRLIRTKTDVGIVAILDPRIKTKYYGRFFLNSLPDCDTVTDIQSVKQFFDTQKIF
ncbi:MAG: hypothetical protein MRK01_06565 [Candidatus Scalindua sp.]|nr:hypothetical protein [Candidatus Scalindua sp.]